MSEQEAIKEVRFNMSTIGLKNETAERVIEARNIAIKSLEKQVAKKPRIWANGSKHCPDPDCEETVFYHDAHCIQCGQKLDWSDEE